MIFNFSLGLAPIAKSLQILAVANGFITSTCEVTQVAVSHAEWAILVDLKERYLSYSNDINHITILKQCESAEEVADAYLVLLKTIILG